ncbi:hypothetical protein GALMADRAFT_807798 [Galerina marginata CBS 339.88]|uniref:NACHT domain-containing protein n=1 Tax=Galerina marginata (strain CBS 339.88) TaxID=685588 RepID=A0A067SWJ5_GALM3|nr:hypothetical protein GALMADRAFT_807798 [Galerina marginata CBS 339.88]
MSGEPYESVQSLAAFHHPRPSDSERSQNAPSLAISEGFFNYSQNMIVSGGNFNYIQSNNSGFLRIEKAAVSAAMHTSGEEFQRPGCYENTRVAVLERLRNWGVAGKAEEDADERVMWLYGDAGAGKSAIAQTLAVDCAKMNRLLGSFFFFRNDPDRADHSHLVVTLIYQAVTVIPTLKAHVAAIVEQDPKIFEKDLELQLQSLLIDPLNALARRPGFSLSSIPRFIIIDGLDECSTPDKQSHLLKVLVRMLQKCAIPLKVLIASRPEIEIKAAFNSAPLTSLATRLALDNSFKPGADIRHFLRATFQTIKGTHPFKSRIPASWPNEQDLEVLVHKSSRQFIYAAIVAKFVSSRRHKPVQRLGIVLGLHPIESEKDYPFAELDALYTFLFSAIPTEKLEIARKILGLIIVVNPLSLNYTRSLLVMSQLVLDNAENICEFLSLEPGDEQYYLADLASVLQFEPLENGGETETQIQITHASLSDFLLDSKRSKDFFISPNAFATDVLHTCFRHLKNLTLNDRLLHHCFEKTSLSSPFSLRQSFL